MRSLTICARARASLTGAYGVVCSAKNKLTGDSIAIKKVIHPPPSEGHRAFEEADVCTRDQVTKVFQKKILTKRALRELKWVVNLANAMLCARCVRRRR